MSPRRKKILQRFIAAALAISTVLILILITDHVRGKRAWNRRVTELQQRGENLTVDRFIKSKAAPAENTYATLLALTNASGSLGVKTSAPKQLQFGRPGEATPSWRLPQWVSSDNTTNDWAKIQSELDAQSDLLAKVRDAALKPHYDTRFDYKNGFLDYPYRPLSLPLRAAELLSAATLNELRNARLDQTHTNLLALLRFTANQREPMVIDQLVRGATVSLAFNATWEALQADGWTDAQMAAWQNEWLASAFAPSMEAAMEAERAMTINLYDDLRNSPAQLARKLSERERNATELGLAAPLPTQGWLLHHFHAPVWRFAWSRHDQLRALNRWQSVIERTRLAHTNSWAQLKQTGEEPEATPSLGPLDRLRFLMASDTFSVSDGAILRSLTSETLQELAVTAIALARHRKATAALPTELPQLTPHFLPRLPRDWMDGKVLRYQPVGTKSFILYSIGEDYKDDQGDARPATEKTRYNAVINGRDIVWPTHSR